MINNTNDSINYYKEPVNIEVYLKQAGKVRTIIRDLKIELVDVVPKNNEYSPQIFELFKSTNEPIDLMELQNNFPQLIKIIYDSYYKNMELYEKLSINFKSAISGINSSWRQTLYLTELLIKYEPTIASSQFIGDFQTYNLNYIIKKLNSIGEKFLLEDDTVRYLINRHLEKNKDNKNDKEFEKLVELWKYNAKGNPY